MKKKDIQAALQYALENSIPFDVDCEKDYQLCLTLLDQVASAQGFTCVWPHQVQDRAGAFHFSEKKGLRWGKVVNTQKRTGWMEDREPIPLTERDFIIKDSEKIFTKTEHVLYAAKK